MVDAEHGASAKGVSDGLKREMASKQITGDYPLHRLFEGHTGKASDKWEQYLIAYESELAAFRAGNAPVRLLEIGVQNGGSLELWHDYLPKGSTCLGLDIDERVAELAYEEGISVSVCDATNKTALEQAIGCQTFDVIIDDGSHRCRDVVATFGLLFARLAPLGKYFIEDLHCSYCPDFGGGLRLEGSSIEFLKTLIDALNFDHIRMDDLPELDRREFMEAHNRCIARITFYDSLCVIQKTASAKERPYRRALTGVDEQLVPTSSLLRSGQLGRAVLLGGPLLRQVEDALLTEVETLRASSAALSDSLERALSEKARIELAFLESAKNVESLLAELAELKEKYREPPVPERRRTRTNQPK